MPRSKRNQVVAVTQTSKKSRSQKSEVVQKIQNAIDAHDNLYVFEYETMRSTHFKKVRFDLNKLDWGWY